MSDDANWNEWIASDHWVQYILDRPVTSEPGTVFSYSTGIPIYCAPFFKRQPA